MSFTNNSWGDTPAGGWTEPDPVSYMAGEPKYLSKLPLYLIIAILVLSVLLLVLPFNSSLLPIVGYLLTPFASIGMLAWASAADSKLRLDVWYDRKVGILVAIRALAAVSFVVGMVHMWEVATIIARSAAGGIL